ncbi:MAG: UrcA family protein [Hyphomonas sp.]
MFKSTVSVLVAAFALSPVALAEGGKEVTLSHTYDTALLETDAGATALIADLKKAAKRVCTTRIPASGTPYVDRDCAESLVMAAVKDIHAAQTENGVAIAPAFERVALVQLASAD